MIGLASAYSSKTQADEPPCELLLSPASASTMLTPVYSGAPYGLGPCLYDLDEEGKDGRE